MKAAGQNPVLVIESNKFFDVATDRCASEIGHKMSYFMATGNIRTMQLDLQQVCCTVTASGRYWQILLATWNQCVALCSFLGGL